MDRTLHGAPTNWGHTQYYETGERYYKENEEHHTDTISQEIAMQTPMVSNDEEYMLSNIGIGLLQRTVKLSTFALVTAWDDVFFFKALWKDNEHRSSSGQLQMPGHGHGPDNRHGCPHRKRHRVYSSLGVRHRCFGTRVGCKCTW